MLQGARNHRAPIVRGHFDPPGIRPNHDIVLQGPTGKYSAFHGVSGVNTIQLQKNTFQPKDV